MTGNVEGDVFDSTFVLFHSDIVSEGATILNHGLLHDPIAAYNACKIYSQSPQQVQKDGFAV